MDPSKHMAAVTYSVLHWGSWYLSLWCLLSSVWLIEFVVVLTLSSFCIEFQLVLQHRKINDVPNPFLPWRTVYVGHAIWIPALKFPDVVFTFLRMRWSACHLQGQLRPVRLWWADYILYPIEKFIKIYRYASQLQIKKTK